MSRKENLVSVLKEALQKYKTEYINIRPFSLGYETTTKRENLEGKILSYQTNNNLELYIGKKLFHTFPLKKQGDKGFSFEYQDGKNMRLEQIYSEHSPEVFSKEDVKTTALRLVIDDLLLEIYFKGKIELERDIQENDEVEYWKIKNENPQKLDYDVHLS